MHYAINLLQKHPIWLAKMKSFLNPMKSSTVIILRYNIIYIAYLQELNSLKIHITYTHTCSIHVTINGTGIGDYTIVLHYGLYMDSFSRSHTCRYTYVHGTHMQAYTYMHKQPTYMYTCICMYIYMLIHTEHIHTYRYTHTRTHAHIHLHRADKRPVHISKHVYIIVIGFVKRCIVHTSNFSTSVIHTFY